MHGIGDVDDDSGLGVFLRYGHRLISNDIRYSTDAG